MNTNDISVKLDELSWWEIFDPSQSGMLLVIAAGFISLSVILILWLVRKDKMLLTATVFSTIGLGIISYGAFYNLAPSIPDEESIARSVMNDTSQSGTVFHSSVGNYYMGEMDNPDPHEDADQIACRVVDPSLTYLDIASTSGFVPMLKGNAGSYVKVHCIPADEAMGR